MNKTTLVILAAFIPALLYVIFAIFNPIPPVSAQYVEGVNSFAQTITAPFAGFFTNLTALGTSIGGTVAGGYVVNYVKSRSHQVYEQKATEAMGEMQSQITDLYKTNGQLAQKNLDLENQVAQTANAQAQIDKLSRTVEAKDNQILQLQWQLGAKNKENTDDVVTKVKKELLIE